MKYKAKLIQVGEGCDYTIGCGQLVIDIDANSLEDANVKLQKIIKEEYRFEQSLKSCELYEVHDTHIIDVDVIYKQLEIDEMNRQQSIDDALERAEYERLRYKFN